MGLYRLLDTVPDFKRGSKMETKKIPHKLNIISFSDAQAECEGCGWSYCGTGERTEDEIRELYKLNRPDHEK